MRNIFMFERIYVLIVGGDPAGLTLSCDLPRLGVRVRIVDAACRGFFGYGAKAIQPRTLGVLDDLGVLGDVVSQATAYPNLGIHLDPVTLPKTMIRPVKPNNDVPYPDTLLVAQYASDAG